MTSHFTQRDERSEERSSLHWPGYIPLDSEPRVREGNGAGGGAGGVFFREVRRVRAKLSWCIRWARIEWLECFIGAPFLSRWAEMRAGELQSIESRKYHPVSTDSDPLLISPCEVEYNPCAGLFRWDWTRLPKDPFPHAPLVRWGGVGGRRVEMGRHEEYNARIRDDAPPTP